MSKESEAELRRNPSGRTVNPVRVVSINVPFVDVLVLTFQALVASLVVAIPIAFIFWLFINS